MMAASLPSPKLPLEILLCIIEETALSSRQTLHSLALLSPSTLPFCRKYIFNQLTLGGTQDRPAGEEIQSIEDFFSRKPRVAGYVRRLVLDNPRLGEPACSAYASVLSKLQNVHEFLLVSCTWTTIPAHLKSSILDITQNSSLRSLHLKYIRNVPLDLLVSSTSANLTSLGLEYVTFQAHNPAAPGTEMLIEDSIPCLQSLVVESDFFGAFARLLAVKQASGNLIVGLSRLQRCVLCWYLQEHITATVELMKIAHQIEHLQLELRRECILEGLAGMLAYGSVHTLKSMGLVFSFLTPARFRDSLQELYQVSPTNVLEELAIEYSFYAMPGRTLVEVVSVSVLGLLKVFTRARFPRLRLLALTLRVSPREGGSVRSGAAHQLEQVNLEPFKDTCAAVGIKFRFTVW